MPLTVLSYKDVKELLDGLSIADVEALLGSLRKALHEYSTGTQGGVACVGPQPERTSIQSPNGTTTLFMPVTSPAGIGMKVVTLATPSESSEEQNEGDFTPRGTLAIMTNTGLPIGFVDAEEITAFRTALASSLLLVRRSNLKTLTVFGAGKQAYWHIRLALLLRGHNIKVVNIINRTFSARAKALLKTFLHIDHDIKSHEGWMHTKFGLVSPEYGEYGRLLKDQLRAADVIITTVPSTRPLFDPLILTSAEGRRKGRLLIAIGSYKPHMIEIPVECLHQAVRPGRDRRHFHRHAAEGGVVVVDTLTGCLKEAGEIIQAALSPMQLVELGELVMLEEAEPPSPPSDRDLEKLSLEDSSTSSSITAPVVREGINAGRVSPTLMHPRSTSFSRALSLPRPWSWSADRQTRRDKRSRSVEGRKAGSGSDGSNEDKEDSMSKWLRRGNVIYKSVGMGLMDLAVGGELVRFAREKGVGTTIYDF